MKISIATAQNVSIAYKPAGLVNRIGATIIDLSLLGGLFLLSTIIISTNTAWKNSSIPFIITGIILACYHLLFEYFLNGKSVGKLVLHLRVVRLDGRKLTFWDCLLRWVLRLVDISGSAGILAMLSIIVTSKMQRLGDLAAGTTVVQENTNNTLDKLKAYDTPEDYQVIFPQVILLSDKDISIVKEVLQEVNKSHEYKLLLPLAGKIKALTSIETDRNNQEFIQTVLKDYNYLTKN